MECLIFGNTAANDALAWYTSVEPAVVDARTAVGEGTPTVYILAADFDTRAADIESVALRVAFFSIDCVNESVHHTSVRKL